MSDRSENLFSANRFPLRNLRGGVCAPRAGRFSIRRWLSLALLLGICMGCSSWKQKMAVLDSESQDLVEQVRNASESGRHEKAAELLQQAVASNPNNAGVRKQLSEFLISNGYSEEAIQQLKKTMVLSPDDPKPYIDLAYLLYEKKQYTDSLKNLELGLTLDPVNIRALLLKGELEELAGLNSASVETYHRVLQAEPYNLVSRLKMAELQIKMGEPNRATPILRPICHNTAATIEQRSEAQWLLGIAYGAEQRWNDSVRSLELALKNREDATADDWYRMAYACLQANEMEKVYQSVTQALSLNPEHSETNRLSSYLTQQLDQVNIQQASLYTPLQRPGFIGQSALRIPLETLQPPPGWQKSTTLSISSDSHKVE